MAQNVYDFTVKDRRGNDVSLTEYKGKVLLIVNTATRCGFTPQYEELEALYKNYKDVFQCQIANFNNWKTKITFVPN